MQIPHNLRESTKSLLKAAVRLMLEKAYRATRVGDVCKAAGPATGSFFHHFRSKEELAVTAGEHWDEITQTPFASAPYRPRRRYVELLFHRKAGVAV
jgi:TetR/AcrR family transcriptional repressor of nem operon